MVLRTILQSSASHFTLSVSFPETYSAASNILGSDWRSRNIKLTRMRVLDNSKNSKLRIKAVMESFRLPKEIIIEQPKEGGTTEDFRKMKKKFLDFKSDIYMRNPEVFNRLSENQSPKFMVIACADSRVCPSKILGFEPGEAFCVRNVANMVPSHESGPSETNAALEFAVNTLLVENILIVGHSRCGGIQALMSLPEEANSSFIANWVRVGKPARSKTRSVASHLNFDQQCKHCEKESINKSLLNLLTYPWIEEKVRQGKLSLHGGYYDFTDCSFEKWTVDYAGNGRLSDTSLSIKDQELWT